MIWITSEPLAPSWSHQQKMVQRTATLGPRTMMFPWTSAGQVVLGALPFIDIGSPRRQTPLPSTRTSGLELRNLALPLMTCETTPPPAVPPSSPVLVENSESLSAIGRPSTVTVRLPLARSFESA